MIYLMIKGRIGNQLFMYAAARAIQLKYGFDEPIVIDDYMNAGNSYLNALPLYNLPNVLFDSNRELYKSIPWWKRKVFKIFDNVGRKLSTPERWRFETKIQKLLNRLGICLFEFGYYPFTLKKKGDIIMCGYFQSESYFKDVRQQILDDLSVEKLLKDYDYPNLSDIKARNTVCISIKVEDNADNKLYRVCTREYWEKAIRIIERSVDNPLFFVCSDNVEYVKENYIDTSKYDVIEQDMRAPINLSLAAMSKCKHFIIGNTSYGWWAQYLCTYKEKKVIAPSRWYSDGAINDILSVIYQDNWELVEV